MSVIDARPSRHRASHRRTSSLPSHRGGGRLRRRALVDCAAIRIAGILDGRKPMRNRRAVREGPPAFRQFRHFWRWVIRNVALHLQTLGARLILMLRNQAEQVGGRPRRGQPFPRLRSCGGGHSAMPVRRTAPDRPSHRSTSAHSRRCPWRQKVSAEIAGVEPGHLSLQSRRKLHFGRIFAKTI